MSKAIDKVLDVLELFLNEGEGLSIAEISKLGKINPATAWRYVSSLVERGYLAETPGTGQFHLALRTIDFAYAARRNLKFIDFAYLPLTKLSKKTECDVYMTVLDAGTSLVIEEIGTTEALRINSPIGRRMSLHSTACGKVHLAAMSESERRGLYDGGELERFTKNTIIDPQRLEEELAAVRRDGVAYDREEQRLGVWVVAAPIYSGKEQIAAAGIITPVSRIRPDTIANHVLKIISCTGEISMILSRTS